MEINGQTVSGTTRYDQMGLSPELIRAVEKKGYVEATPIQTGAVPHFMEWKDVIAKAPTGTGKTFAFGIPMVEHTDPAGSDITGLVLAPTRELAIQIRDELRDLCAFKEGVRVVCLYGGQPINSQITQLKKRPQIVVATPGRLMDHMKRRTIRLDQVETVVLDEADRMLDMGFVRDVTHILDTMPQRKNLGMFSATISREVLDISWVYQREPVEITVQADQENRPDIAQYRLDVDRGEAKELPRKVGMRPPVQRWKMMVPTPAQNRATPTSRPVSSGTRIVAQLMAKACWNPRASAFLAPSFSYSSDRGNSRRLSLDRISIFWPPLFSCIKA